MSFIRKYLNKGNPTWPRSPPPLVKVFGVGSLRDAIDVVKDPTEQRLVLHGSLDLVLVDAEAELRVLGLLRRLDADEAAALQQRDHGHCFGQAGRGHVALLADLAVGLVELAHRHLFRLPPVVGDQQKTGHQQLLVQRQVRVLLTHRGRHGRAVDLVDDLQDLRDIDWLDRAAAGATCPGLDWLQDGLLASFEFRKLDRSATNIQSFSDVSRQGRNFCGQEGDGRGLDDGLVGVVVELLQAGGDDLADLLARVGGEVDFSRCERSAQLEMKNLKH